MAVKTACDEGGAGRGEYSACTCNVHGQRQDCMHTRIRASARAHLLLLALSMFAVPRAFCHRRHKHARGVVHARHHTRVQRCAGDIPVQLTQIRLHGARAVRSQLDGVRAFDPLECACHGAGGVGHALARARTSMSSEKTSFESSCLPKSSPSTWTQWLVMCANLSDRSAPAYALPHTRATYCE